MNLNNAYELGVNGAISDLEKNAGIKDILAKLVPKSTTGKVLGGLGVAGAGGLGVAKAVQPNDPMAYGYDSSTGNYDNPHFTYTKKRPLFFGREEHMSRAADPKRFGTASPHPGKTLSTATAIADKTGTKVNVDKDEHMKDWIANAAKKGYMQRRDETGVSAVTDPEKIKALYRQLVERNNA